MSRASRPSLSEHPVIARGGHFLQEDAPRPEVAAAVNVLIAATPSP